MKRNEAEEDTLRRALSRKSRERASSVERNKRNAR
jgi:hypothetical protein